MLTIKKTESLNLGKILKEARRSLGLSLEKCSRALKIQKKYLERLEAGLYENLPSDVYTKNFLKIYSKFLNLDVEEMMQYYRVERMLNRNLSVQKTAIRSIKSPKIIITPRAIALFIFICLFLFTAGYLIFQLKKLMGRPDIFLEYPKQDIATSSKEIQIRGRADPSAYLTINGQPVNLERNGRFEEMISLQPDLNTIRLEAVNRFGKKKVETIKIIRE